MTVFVTFFRGTRHVGILVGRLLRLISDLSVILSVGIGVILNLGTFVGLSVRLSLVRYMVGPGVMWRMEISPWMNLPVNPNVVTTATKVTKVTAITTIKIFWYGVLYTRIVDGSYGSGVGGTNENKDLTGLLTGSPPS